MGGLEQQGREASSNKYQVNIFTGRVGYNILLLPSVKACVQVLLIKKSGVSLSQLNIEVN
jgi:hypothetical protein